MTDRASVNTVRYRLPAITRNLVRNVRRCHEKATIRINRSWEDRTVIVVGAGPSLDRNIDLIAEAQSSGAIVVAVNSALPSLARHGIVADLAVGIESIPNERHYAHENWKQLAVQWTCAPELWDIAELWFADAQPTWGRLCRWLGVSSVPCGSSVSGAAVALAIRLGAETVALAGMDLAYDLEAGKSYADGAVWQDWRPTLDGTSLRFEGAQDRDEHRRGIGVVGVPREQVPHRYTAWGGEGEVVTDITLVHQLDWFSWIGPRIKGTKLIDATEGGARKTGWCEQRLSEVVRDIYRTERGLDLDAYHVPAETVRDAEKRVREEGAAAERFGQRMLDGEPALGELVDPMPLARALAVPDITGLNDTPGLGEYALLEATWMVWREAGRLLQRMTE